MVDFEKNRDLRMWIMEHTGGPAAGGLTVRDVAAITAMGVILEATYHRVTIYEKVAEEAYAMADAMLAARITLPPKQDVSLEEAFGFDTSFVKDAK